MRRKLVLSGVAFVVIGLAADAVDRVAPLGTYADRERRHWSFVKRSHPAVPSFATPAEKSWAANAVDAFILQRLKQEGLKPSPAADRATLVRRLYFDMLGLPPTPADVSQFVADKAPDAYSKLVEKLLASPQYGERWGQHWLDVVRFAETDGFEYDTHRTTPGAIATTSSARSTTTSPTTASSRNNSPATRLRPRKTRR